MTGQIDGRARSVLVAAGWLIAAAAATTVGVVAAGAIGSSIAGTTISPVSQQQVDRALARSSQATSPPASASPAASGGVTRALGTPGGTIIARCLAGQATLVSWSPAQGYESGDIHGGPARAAAVTFETEDAEIRVRIDCPGGMPTAHITAQGHGGLGHD